VWEGQVWEGQGKRGSVIVRRVIVWEGQVWE